MAQLLQVGDMLDKYRVDRCLGIGGMGEVYLVTHSYLKVQRALKILRLDLTEQDSTFRDRFVREARIAARFQHPNSIGVVDVESESDSGFLYLVMEYVEGQSLQQYLKNGVLEENQVLHICREVASALDVAWRDMQLVHRDIKPGNIMISTDGAIKLADLGIAKAAQSESGMTMTLTMAGSMIGTPEYASPEQCKDASRVDTRADIYSLGATMYEMLTGIRPFRGSNAFEIMEKVLKESPKPLREWNPSVSQEMADLVERMMSKDMTARPQTMGELIRILDEMLSGREIESSPITPEMLDLIRAEAAQKAEQIAAERVKTILKKQKVVHFYDTLLAVFLVVVNVVLGSLYVRNKTFYKNSLNAVEQKGYKKIRTAENRGIYPGRIKRDNQPYVLGVLYSADGKELIECYIPDDDELVPQNLYIMDITERMRADAVTSENSLISLRVPLPLYTQMASKVSTFRQLKRITVTHRNDQVVPDVFIPPHIAVSKRLIYRYTSSLRHIVKKIRPDKEKTEPVKKVTVAPVKEENVLEDALDTPPVTTQKAALTLEQQEAALLAVLAGTKKKVEAQKTEQLEKQTSVMQPEQSVKTLVQVAASLFTGEKKNAVAPDLNSRAYKDAMADGMRFSNDGRTLLRFFNNSARKCKVPEGVETISRYAFYRVRNLERVILPSTLKHIQYSAFSNCAALCFIKLPDGLKRIESSAFNGCRKLFAITLPDSLEFIGSEAFMNTALKSLSLPSGVNNIMGRICDSDTKLQISPSHPHFKKDQYGAIYSRCGKVFVLMNKQNVAGGSYTVAPGTEVISSSAFSKSEIFSITLPPSITRIGDSAFRDCSELVQLNLPPKLKTIGSYAFRNCPQLTLTIPASVERIEYNALCGVKEVTIAKGNRYFFKDPPGGVYDKKARKLIYFPPQYLMRSYSVVPGAHIIGSYAFENCENLHEVILPPSLKIIESRAFNHCPRLNKIEIPSGVQRINSLAFVRCSRLKKVIIPQNTKLGRNAFDPYVKVVRAR